jgi:hypothetical protein
MKYAAVHLRVMMQMLKAIGCINMSKIVLDLSVLLSNYHFSKHIFT